MSEALPARDFYPGIKRYNGKKSLQKALSAGLITQNDVNLIDEFVTERKAQKTISEGRVNKITFTLVNWRRFITKPYRDVNYVEVYQAINALKDGNNVKGTPFKQNTIHDYIRILKPFLLWMIESGYTNLPEKKIRGIAAPPVDYETTKPDEILAPEEIKALIGAAMNPRDRAFVSCFYESGGRISEICRLKWKNVIFDNYGVRLYLDDQKTKKQRYSRLTMSRQYLAAWKDDYHPGEVVPEATVFITFKGGSFDYIQAVRTLQRLVARAGLPKKVQSRLFRKSRITHLVTQNYQESVIKKSIWNNLNTQMFKTYVCLAEKDIDAEFLDRAGIKSKDEVEKVLRSRPCPECHTVNGPTTRFCPVCGKDLTEEARDLSDVLRDAKDDPDTLIEYANWLKERKRKSNLS